MNGLARASVPNPGEGMVDKGGEWVVDKIVDRIRGSLASRWLAQGGAGRAR